MFVHCLSVKTMCDVFFDSGPEVGRVCRCVLSVTYDTIKLKHSVQVQVGGVVVQTFT